MSADDSAAKNGHELREPRLWPVPAAIGLGVVLQAASMWAFAENLSYLVFTSLFIILAVVSFPDFALVDLVVESDVGDSRSRFDWLSGCISHVCGGLSI